MTRDFYDMAASGVIDAPSDADLLDVTDADGDRLIVFPNGPEGHVSVVLERDGKRLATYVLAETLADALLGYLLRDEESVRVDDGIGMTRAQYDAAVRHYIRSKYEGDADRTDYLRDLQRRVFENSRDHGFYEDAPLEEGPANDAYLGNKLMLVVGKVAEAHEELRKGKRPDETYYLDGAGEPPLDTFLEDARARGTLLKPEGVPSELADIVIRVLDLAEACGIDLASVIEEKHAYNVSRPYKHAKKF